jgi:hypothetical protein
MLGEERLVLRALLGSESIPCGNAVVWCHATVLHLQRKSGCTVLPGQSCRTNSQAAL